MNFFQLSIRSPRFSLTAQVRVGIRRMATERQRLPHEDRTATEPRDSELRSVILDKIEPVNDSIKLYQLRIKDEERGLRFLPGQWIDLHIPGIPKAGGFTITSRPAEAKPISKQAEEDINRGKQRKKDALPTVHDINHNEKTFYEWPRREQDDVGNKFTTKDGIIEKHPARKATDEEIASALQARFHSDPQKPYIELAVQESPRNPPATWLWRDPDAIIGTELQVRVGGSFTWPPFGWSEGRVKEIKKVVMVAGGVGVNPLISMVNHMHWAYDMPPSLEFLYSTKAINKVISNIKLDAIRIEDIEDDPEAKGILFFDRLASINACRCGQVDVRFFLTGPLSDSGQDYRLSLQRRIEQKDLLNALGPKTTRMSDRKDRVEENVRTKTVCYVCGPPLFTDWAVEFFRKQEGMSEDRVFCEKWW